MAVYVFNGLTDIAGDRANGSTRPIVTGQLSAGQAAVGCGIAAISGLALCLQGSVRTGVLGLCFLALGWAYSAGPQLKRSMVGFAVIIGCGAGLTYVVGDADGRGGVPLVPLVAFSFWVAVSCAAKDFSDVAGDRIAGRRSWPVVSCWA